MAGKIVIEIFREKSIDELSKILSDPESKLDIGSGLAVNSAVAASYLCRAAAVSKSEGKEWENMEQTFKNLESYRDYMVYLVDEDVKCHRPLRQAVKKEAGPGDMEATRRTAVAICEELVNMTGSGIALAEELVDVVSESAKPYLVEALYTIMAAAKSAVCYILSMSSLSPDETYRYVTRRENEIMMQQYDERYEKLMAKFDRMK